MRRPLPILNCNGRVPLTFLPYRTSHEVAGNVVFLGKWGKSRDVVPDSPPLLAMVLNFILRRWKLMGTKSKLRYGKCRQTFDSIGRWLNELHALSDMNVVTILVGNKTDLRDARGVQHKPSGSSDVSAAFRIVVKEKYSILSRKVCLSQ
ncbi:hypothetical protein OPV22_025254 [Ensete ventricosum]|uniref:Uncharacterized protein n=1 Tax=Ensete ventricosum TaxID=4639 RepID=A0AAV8P7A5_ENSVE|nr:hypothetical protein OPV22_025254 [Ensete ventricosum]